MNKIIIAVAVFGLFYSPVLAMEKCDTELPDMIEKLKESTKISDQAKKKYIPHLEESLKHCKAGNLEKVNDKMNKMQDQFFRDALYHQQTFYGN